VLVDNDPPLSSGEDSQSEVDAQHAVDPVADRRDRMQAFRFVGWGMELAGFTLVFAGVGYFVDSTLQLPKSYATAAGTLLGFTIGMIRFIQQALQVTQRSSN
jgi:F0F1-type ATP synthase assembly protein I